ncbi:4'-phosphopantetheinyl transferase family protein [Microbacterium sp. NPDC087665]|uniref:4'-phosphopantetheinyl transferase family protein n=1 Tax=Microbacterium sp. NPDC087665 TaxID=3364194 RepID=UPI003806CF1C
MEIEQRSLGPVRIAWTDASFVDADLDAIMRRLGGDQLHRYRQLDAVRARRFATGRLLLTALVAPTHDGATTISSVCAHCGGDHGRPQVDGAPLAVNLSYAGDMVVAAAVPRISASAVGIDVERVSSDGPAGLLRDLAPLYAPLPPPTLERWTAFEAVVKADGRGLRIPPADVAFGEASALLLPGGQTVRIAGERVAIEVAPAPGPPGHTVSIAIVAA